MSADTRLGRGATPGMDLLAGALKQKATKIAREVVQRNAAKSLKRKAELSGRIAGLSGMIDLASALPLTEAGRYDLAIRSVGGVENLLEQQTDNSK